MSKKLLLADDSVTIQKVVNLTFADEGIEVITAGDGNAAMQMLFETAPDLVMADVNMPGLNGYQVCEQIKQNENLKNTPVILLVGSFEPFDEDEARRVGADDFLTKPFQSIRQLVNKVSTLLQSAANGRDFLSETGGLADTREFEKAGISEPAETRFEAAQNAPSAEYGDTGMDDEMIQANSSAGFAFDESQKFNSRSYRETTEDDLSKTQPYSTEDWYEISPDESAAKPETVSTVAAYESGEEFSSGTELPKSDSAAAAEEEEISQPQTLSGEENNQTQPTPEELPQPQTASLLEYGDDDILELPSLFDEEETEVSEVEETSNVEETSAVQEVSESPQIQDSPAESAAAENFAEPIGETFVKTPAAEEDQAVAPAETKPNLIQLSPETIDAIAQRVVEKLSDPIIREIAWEVVPQQAELIIKKMVEEKLKE